MGNLMLKVEPEAANRPTSFRPKNLRRHRLRKQAR